MNYNNKNNNCTFLSQNYNKQNVRFNLNMINFNWKINFYQKQINKLSSLIKTTYKVLNYKIMTEPNKLPLFTITRYKLLKIKFVMKEIT